MFLIIAFTKSFKNVTMFSWNFGQEHKFEKYFGFFLNFFFLKYIWRYFILLFYVINWVHLI
jgi:hypothetical protein